ncbi:DUF2935 domain-containing protein [Clostridium sp.]|uniref:DUF2935 domain-containing protein n=1 Tax=Clostridium sp. TaxID=1506 RepID=UPI002614496E|nr:DUF2935 domain-containing protein [Clostridium sp.]
MLSKNDFIKFSIEINLFFQRIIKEHLFLIETNLQPVESNYILQSKMLKDGFEKLLAETISYANGSLSKCTIESNEFVTPYTLKAEEVTSKLTGASINTDLTKSELKLSSSLDLYSCNDLEDIIYNLNCKSYTLLKEVIAFKKKLLSLSLNCKIFITLYPHLLEHTINEAEYYLEILEALKNKNLPEKSLCEDINFWNHTMEDHGEFINGMLDPTEKDLKKTAENFIEEFEDLVKECIEVANRKIIKDSLEYTEEFKNYKMAAIQGLLQCKIKSIIPPLLADHVLREANHYLRLLKMLNK